MENLKVTIELNAPELITTINNLVQVISGMNFVQNVQTVSTTNVQDKTEKVEKVEKAEVKTETKIAETSTEKAITLEEVRAKLEALTQGGKQAEVKALIESYGVAKLTQIPAENYAEMLKKAEGI